jgi:hypothetical protein
MAAKASKRQGEKKGKLRQASVERIWADYFKRRAEADRRKREARTKATQR